MANPPRDLIRTARPVRPLRTRCLLAAIAVAGTWLAAGALGAEATDPNLSELDQLLESAVQEAATFPEVPRELELHKHLDILPRIFGPRCTDLLVVDDERVRKHFQDPEDARLREILRRWGLDKFRLETYLSVPFFIDVQPAQDDQPGKIRFVISPKLLDKQGTPTSTRLYYVAMLKAYAALPTVMKTAPTGWSHGLSSLVALDATTPTALASCPDLAIETATAALLFHKEPRLVWDAWAGPEHRFDAGAYQLLLKNAITAVGSRSPDEALKELLRSPEEYHAQDQGERKESEEKKEEERAPLPRLEPGMKALWLILPETEEGLRSAADDIAKTIKTTSLRKVLLSACYDKLCALVGQQRAAAVADSSTLLRMAALGHLDEMGVKSASLLNDFERRKEQVWQSFREDLAKRNQSAAPVAEMAFDPAMLKWTFRFLYNFSLPVRKAEKEFRDKLAKEIGQEKADEQQTDREVVKRITPAVMREWWLADPHLRELFKVVGEPMLDLRPSPDTATGLELDCRWRLTRQGTKEPEEIRLRFVDAFSSGGGKPTPGVWDKAQVVVRKTLQSAPEAIPLKEIQKNYYVQTLRCLDESEEADEPEDQPKAPQQDWARVVTVDRLSPRLTWHLDSGAAQALEVGRKQFVWAQLKGLQRWDWHLPLPLRSGEDWLFGIQPEGPVPAGQSASFFSARIASSGPSSGRHALLVLQLSHRGVKKVQESGAEIWGYFADARFVQAEVFPPLAGVDGEAMVEVPEGQRPLQTLLAKKPDGKSDQVHAFDYYNPNTFVDSLSERQSNLAKVFIEISYTLPAGGTNTIRVAEGQRFVVYDAAKRRVTRKKAYQLQPGHELVCAFDGRSQPQTARIQTIELREAPLGVYSMKLKSCVLVRANGILIPVQVEPTKVYPGVDAESQIQMGSDAVIRESTAERIDVARLEQLPAKSVNPGASFLAYNRFIEPYCFWSAAVSDVKDYQAERYVRIVTPQATLTCGHLQEIYVTEGDWSGVKEVQASLVQPGRHKVVWLCPQGKTASLGSEADAQRNILAAAERAMARARDTLPVAEAGATPGTLHLIPVLGVQPMLPTQGVPVLPLRAFTTADTRIARIGLRPTMFANGIMVKVRFEFPGDEDEGEGQRGPTPRPAKVSKERNPGEYQPSYGVIRDFPPTRTIQFFAEDLTQLERTRGDFLKAFEKKQLRMEAVRREVLARFLSQYFAGPRSADKVYQNLGEYRDGYLQARDFLVQTGTPKILPGVVNGYVFLATLLYEAGAVEAGDALTRDFLCLTLRATLPRKTTDPTSERSSGKVFYEDPESLVRYGIMCARDLIRYVRDKNSEDGFAPAAKVEFPAASFEEVLKHFVEKEGASADVLAGANVNLYNLCRQLDKWSGVRARLFESIVSPGLRASEVFSSPVFREKLHTRSQGD